ncbi:uncharacterized protein AMSG_08563 [Thecamonas trahens ATCC 50062]|uniref:Membrane protein n=1 Tax=Thecamonas trahens ATCC 50062 TaxID=461836 RepID=A0A0L0DMQ4_THETB|nr:membrane protein [Thecamonas trahens ATCC 50062]KNC52688.1 membrane protein [Thecamonas trahens ATCC 50062]|eukprot:XP_013755232.1 membrane protein [Thecamonas trahens ATCC 50062]
MGWQPAVFDPWLIVAQLVALTAVFYVTAGVVMMLLLWCVAAPPTLHLLLSADAMDVRIVRGWLVVLAYLAAPALSALAIRWLVGRAKKCLDFCVSLYLFHLAFCWASGGWPATWAWWIVNVASAVGMVFLSEHLCMQAELRDIPRIVAVEPEP